MMLVVGAIASGKKTYVRSLGYREEDFANANCEEGRVVYNAQDLVAISESDDDLFEQLAAKDVVICTEVGSGVVPQSSEERAWREQVGRLTCELARRADKVVRMVCGIPVILKDESGE